MVAFWSRGLRLKITFLQPFWHQNQSLHGPHALKASCPGTPMDSTTHPWHWAPALLPVLQKVASCLPSTSRPIPARSNQQNSGLPGGRTTPSPTEAWILFKSVLPWAPSAPEQLTELPYILHSFITVCTNHVVFISCLDSDAVGQEDGWLWQLGGSTARVWWPLGPESGPQPTASPALGPRWWPQASNREMGILSGRSPLHTDLEEGNV